MVKTKAVDEYELPIKKIQEILYKTKLEKNKERNVKKATPPLRVELHGFGKTYMRNFFIKSLEREGYYCEVGCDSDDDREYEIINCYRV